MIDWLNTIDSQVFLALNGLHAPYFDAFMKLFTGKWIWVPMYAAVLFANRKLSLFIFAWAVLNSYSRVYLGVHYPGDLLVGAIIGTAAGLAMAFAAGYVADRVDRPHLKPSVNTGVVTSVGAFTVAVIAVVSCFVRM